jgi:hypothetical protein
MTDQLFKGFGVEIKFDDPKNFLKIKETLTRIGIASKKDKTLYQSCHVLHKQGRYAIFHFKELFALDGKQTEFTNDDKARRNTITSLLAEWKLLEVLDPSEIKEPKTTLANIKVLSHKEKADWTLVTKYNVGKKRTTTKEQA